jgi:hypothetical protein
LELSKDLEAAARQVVDRAQIDAVRNRDRRFSEAAERNWARGTLGGPLEVAKTSAAIDSVHEFSKRATSELINLFKSAYGDVPLSAVDWVLEHVKDRIKSMTSHLAPPEKIGDSLMRGFEEAIKRAAFEAQRDLEVTLAPLKIRHARAVKQETDMQRGTVYNLVGPNARVNIQSVDASTNVIDINRGQLFSEMRNALDDPSVEADRESLRQRIDEMEAEHGKSSFGHAYDKFWELAANHVTVFQSFAPALAQLLAASAG